MDQRYRGPGELKRWLGSHRRDTDSIGMAVFLGISHGNNGVRIGFYKSENRIELSHKVWADGPQAGAVTSSIKDPLRRKKLPVLGQVNYN